MPNFIHIYSAINAWFSKNSEHQNILIDYILIVTVTLQDWSW